MGRNDASVIRGERKDGITSIVFSRPYDSGDRLDIAIPKDDRAVTIVAAIGNLNTKKEAQYHQEFVTKGGERTSDLHVLIASRDSFCFQSLSLSNSEAWEKTLAKTQFRKKFLKNTSHGRSISLEIRITLQFPSVLLEEIEDTKLLQVH